MLRRDKPYIHTPLLYSHRLSQYTGRNIYLKLESEQPSGSFKDRGIGNLCHYYAKQKVKGFISSSGGNAGLAVAFVSLHLKIPATIIIPSTTPHMVEEKLRFLGANVIVGGEIWDETDNMAQAMAKNDSLAYIPPFDHPVIWQGYHSIVEEIQKDITKPDAIILSVGGGGLFSGILDGLHQIGWNDVAMITAEPTGAASLATAMKEKKHIRLDAINTICTTLGAKQICKHAFEWTQKHPVFPQMVTDKASVEAVFHFADDHRLLVEPACGASLAILYEKRSIIQQFKNIVVIVCGGSGVSLALLNEWKKQFNID